MCILYIYINEWEETCKLSKRPWKNHLQKCLFGQKKDCSGEYGYLCPLRGWFLPRAWGCAHTDSLNMLILTARCVVIEGETSPVKVILEPRLSFLACSPLGVMLLVSTSTTVHHHSLPAPCFHAVKAWTDLRVSGNTTKQRERGECHIHTNLEPGFKVKVVYSCGY